MTKLIVTIIAGATLAFAVHKAPENVKHAIGLKPVPAKAIPTPKPPTKRNAWHSSLDGPVTR
jgi:hypothetical protein